MNEDIVEGFTIYISLVYLIVLFLPFLISFNLRVKLFVKLL